MCHSGPPGRSELLPAFCLGSGWWLILLKSKLEAWLGPAVSDQLHHWAFSVGSTGVHCCHLVVFLSLLEVGSHQFLKSWLILILDRPFSLCMWVEHWVHPSHEHQVILSCTTGILTGCSYRNKVGREKPPPGMLSSDTLPTGLFCEHVWQK